MKANEKTVRIWGAGHDFAGKRRARF